MLCDKLKSLWVYCRDINEDEDEDFIEFAKKNGYEELVAKSDVDEAIAELKEFAENACLERDDNQTAIDELQSENRKLKRALWLTRGAVHKAKRLAMYELLKVHPLWEGRPAGLKVHKNIDRYERYERKCLKKAEEYK